MPIFAGHGVPAAEAVVFDLDGTLTDPLEGITRSIQHALAESGAAGRTSDELAVFIGPPLRGTFAHLLGTDDPLLVERAIEHYRERYSTVGLFENAVYPGIEQMLATLREMHYTLFVATSKPRIYARRIAEHFGLAPFFAGIYGAELDGRFDDKSELLAHLLASENLAPGTTAMVGDRSHDMIAAKRNRMRSIGVTYGYGSHNELVAAGAGHICDRPAEIVACVSRPAPSPRPQARD